MQITGINNMHPGNQGVTVYFDGMDTEHLQYGLALLVEDMRQHLLTENLEDETRKVREHQLESIEDMYAQVSDLNEYLDSINPNLVLDSEGLSEEDESK